LLSTFYVPHLQSTDIFVKNEHETEAGDLLAHWQLEGGREVARCFRDAAGLAEPRVASTCKYFLQMGGQITNTQFFGLIPQSQNHVNFNDFFYSAEV
jgi:hypothetical protein